MIQKHLAVVMPETEQQHKPAFHFGLFELSLQTGELRRSGVKLKLQDQPLHILALLVERAGEVVTREEIQKRLWPDNTYVDFDNAINSAVRKLRDALGDSPSNPRFIETLARRGYRFIAPVSQPQIVDYGSPIVSITTAEIPKAKRYRWWAVSLVVLGAAVVAIALIWWITNLNSTGLGTASPPVPLTTYPGFERFPSFSPDGSRVAFSWYEPGKRPSNIYMKMIGAGDPVRLTTNPAGDFAPAWSPDGRSIAFLRSIDDVHASVMLMPGVGGQERELTRIKFDNSACCGFWKGIVPAPFLVWSADGNWLLAVARDEPTETLRIVRISAETGEKRFVLPRVSDSIAGDGSLALSPDGKLLAFTRSATGTRGDIYMVPLTKELLPSGGLQQLTNDVKDVEGLSWSDSRTLIFASTRGGSLELWRLSPVRGSKPVKVAAAGEDPHDIAVSRQAHRLVYARESGDLNIWRLSLNDTQMGIASSLISSTRREFHPRYSPDGRQIAFESDRSGDEQVWIANADGSNARQLTSFSKAWAGSPRWSPDGQKIAFDCDAAGNWDIYVVDAHGGKPVRITNNAANDMKPSWSHDGKWIYFASDRTGAAHIWKTPAESGREIQVTRQPGAVAFESEDGESLYFTPLDGKDLWKVPASGGDEIQISNFVYNSCFRPRKHGIYLIDNRDLQLKVLDSNGSIVRRLPGLSGPIGDDELDVSPDERWATYVRLEHNSSELMLVENFR